jgi:hypothetical protein
MGQQGRSCLQQAEKHPSEKRQDAEVPVHVPLSPIEACVPGRLPVRRRRVHLFWKDVLSCANRWSSLRMKRGNCSARIFLKVLAMKSEQAGFCLPYTSISKEALIKEPPGNAQLFRLARPDLF